jgi:hypothetical protein
MTRGDDTSLEGRWPDLRLCGEAKDGQILGSSRVVSVLEERFELKESSPLPKTRRRPESYEESGW